MEHAPVVMLLATHGEGEPTDNAADFYNWCNEEERDEDEMAGMRFACFALGNTQYEHYCYMGRWAQKRLTELGATALAELGEGNDDEDIRADFEAWTEALWPTLAQATGGAEEEGG